MQTTIRRRLSVSENHVRTIGLRIFGIDHIACAFSYGGGVPRIHLPPDLLVATDDAARREEVNAGSENELLHSVAVTPPIAASALDGSATPFP